MISSDKKITIAAVALGSNLPSVWGDREGALREAVRRVGGLGSVVAVSGFVDTEPIGYVDQPQFLNGALLLQTELGARELMRGLLEVEAAMGRERAGVAAKGPRVIDLDLLLFGHEVIAEEELRVPHPALTERLFVLAPLSQIAGGMVEPVSGRTVVEMLREAEESGGSQLCTPGMT